MSALKAILGRNTDLALIALVMGVLLVLFAPIPSALLDFLILLNFSLALLVLLMTFYAPRPVEFSTFPAILLIATLFRLALNVSATRLILSDGEAGRVINAVGTYVVGGNYVIGMIVFLILVVVQYVVVTNGAQRVSEVAARFTLDSMPGQQMSIDADLNMGFIDQDEAKRRRKTLEREAAFYGAMDGASKFVKGDAIAGIVIMLINIVGGLVIGVLQQGMPWGEALRHFTLLTIGDGIVTQIPALVISVGTGLIVTRSSSDSQLGTEVLRQLGAFPRTLAIVGVVLLGIGLLPGMPLVPVLAIAAGVAAAYFLARNAKAAKAEAKPDDAAQDKLGADDPYAVYDVEPVEVELGSALAQHLGGEQGILMERVAAFRTQFAGEMGFVIPKVRFKESGSLGKEAYAISLFGEVVASAQVMVGKTLAIHPSGDLTLVRGVETREPTYGLPALWIEEADRDAARAARYTLVDAVNVLFTHLCEVMRQRASELLTRTETDKLLGRLRTAQPGLVEELIPTLLAVSDVQKVLQNLMREKVPIRNIQAIVECLVDASRTTKDTGALTEAVRQRLATSICNSLSADRKTLHVMTLDPEVEDGLMRQATGQAGSSDARLIDGLLLRIAASSERMMKSNLIPVVLCAPELRRQLRALCERATPHLRVVSMAEIPPGYELRAFASITAT
ncbi:flagellar biosynthesis protein FlhA [Aquabacterium sp. A7-Y]|uniref:flagellar biosynthesis protein FlhA n=1 Tax=Aquabacterium sp. A7-Y TaxID=1349605 RepID=UPI00223DB664|nr:flagellar biosynthesis protein FlhA [Aquabacterium sp. A7-Y]MCW7540884.1 flagellar biosynthesis protein FlhA [Aquabacterium sp. A7-Y]